MRNISCLGIAVLLAMCGCSQTREVQVAGKQNGGPPQGMDMKQPPVPPQMAKLDAWLGSWTGTAEMISPSPEEMKKTGMPSENIPSSMKGEQKVEKVLGGMYVREEGWHEMGPGQRDSYVMYTTWDGKAGKYRNWYFGDWGESGAGSMTLSADGKTWMVEADTTDAHGQKSKGKGTMKLVGEDTMEWTWTESGPMGKMEMKGTNKRQSK